MPGPNTVVTTGVDGGWLVKTTIPSVSVKLRAYGLTAGINFDAQVTANYATVTVSTTHDVTLSAGRPRVTVRPNTTALAIGNIAVDAPGVDGWIVNNILVPLANGPLRDTLLAAVKSNTEARYNSLLDSLISSLDVSTLGSTFNVQRLDASGNLPMAFGLGFSSVSVTPTRTLFGLSTRFSAPTAQARPSLGIPIPSGPDVLDSAPVSKAAAVSIKASIFEQVAHALWRGGFYNTTLSGTSIGTGVPANVSITSTAQLPPAITMIPEGGAPTSVEISFGALDLAVTDPALGATAIAAEMGARVTATATLAGDDAVFGTFVVSELHYATGQAVLGDAEKIELESVLTTFATRIATATLNSGLPALPIPTYSISASMASLGLPTGGHLGVVTPVIALESRHFALRGAFGIR